MTSAHVRAIQVFTSTKRQTCEQWGEESVEKCIVANSYTTKVQCSTVSGRWRPGPGPDGPGFGYTTGIEFLLDMLSVSFSSVLKSVHKHMLPCSLATSRTLKLALEMRAYVGSSPVNTDDASCFDTSWFSVNKSWFSVVFHWSWHSSESCSSFHDCWSCPY